MKNLKYKKCHVSISGDYYQISFDDDAPEPDNYDDIDEVINSIGPYFLVQFNSEFQGKECFIESDDERFNRPLYCKQRSYRQSYIYNQIWN